MTKVKLCGLSRESDIAAVNKLKPDLVGFVFAKKSKRYVSPEQAAALKSLLAPGILAAGVFVNEPVEAVAELLDHGVIDVAQLHGSEDDDYIARLRALTGKPIFRAFNVKSEADLPAIENCAADLVLLDSGAGTGKTFDWSLVRSVQRPYFLAGGLDPDNIADAVAALAPLRRGRELRHRDGRRQGRKQNGGVRYRRAQGGLRHVESERALWRARRTVRPRNADERHHRA